MHVPADSVVVEVNDCRHAGFAIGVAQWHRRSRIDRGDAPCADVSVRFPVAECQVVPMARCRSDFGFLNQE